MRTPRSSLLTIGAAVTALTLLLTSCGGSGDDTSSATSTTEAGSSTESTGDGATDGEADANGTITIEHAWGSTDVVGTPERIVSLDPSFTDALLAVGVTPVGYVTSDILIEGGILPWQEGLEGVEQIQFNGISYDNQDVFNLDPDLIVGSYSIEDQERFDALSSIAPTIGAVDPDREVQRWQDLVMLAGRVTRQDDLAAQVIADTATDLADRAADLPGLDGKTYTFVNYVPGDALYVVADPDDGAAEVFAALGMSINPKALEAADGATGRAKFSLEQVDLLEADMIIVLANGGDPNDLIGWSALTAVGNDAVVEVDMVEATALNQPTSLSLPWVLDQIGGTLEKAAS